MSPNAVSHFSPLVIFTSSLCLTLARTQYHDNVVAQKNAKNKSSSLGMREKLIDDHDLHLLIDSDQWLLNTEL